MKNAELKNLPIVKYTGPKKPADMPKQEALQMVQSLKVLALAATAAKVASELDFQF